MRDKKDQEVICVQWNTAARGKDMIMRPAVTQMEQGIMPNEGLQDRDRHRRNLEIHREQQKTKGQRTGKLNHIPEFRGEGLAGSEGPFRESVGTQMMGVVLAL